ncbi:MAG: CinA family protein [Bacteroidales bacterium]|nr:CinA family protein [Bacteroidales bacterium]
MKTEYKIGTVLKKNGYTVSAAESCTGGLISHLLTLVSGSSSYYLGSVTSYAVSVKEKVLGVPPGIIDKYGVVSSEVAAAMAEGVRLVTGSTFSVSTTGLAEGSDGHYPEGTVWIGVSGPAGTRTMLYQCNGERAANIRRFASAALRFLYKYIVSEQ